MGGAEGDDDEDGKGREHDDEGGDPEDECVGFGGDDVFFKQQFEGVRDGLEQTVRAHAHGAETDLHVSENLALEPVHCDYGDGEAHEDEKDINHRPEDISRAAGRFVAVEVGLDVQNKVVHQRSTSPRTISSVPITAITSATSWPRHITSSACRFTKDGGRTRMR